MWAETAVPITPEDSHGPVAGVLDSSSQTEYTAEGGAREMPLERALLVVIPPSLPRAKAGLLPPVWTASPRPGQRLPFPTLTSLRTVCWPDPMT